MITKNNISEQSLETMLKEQVTINVSQQIDEEINKKVSQFKKELEDRKDKYIAEVMKGIRFSHERIVGTNAMNYVITFENIVRLETGRDK